jgi:predicted ATPase
VVNVVQSSVLCPDLIGRRPLVEEFQQLLDAASGSRSVFVTISGEAGIGKSRLVSELTAASEGRQPPFVVAHGNCFEFDTATPYALLVDLLRNCLQDKDADLVRECVAGDASELLGLVPDFGSILADVEPAPAREPEQQKRLLFSAITNVLLRLAERQPAVLMLEDLHWCDDVSLEFLGQFARRAAASRFVTVITYRADEVQPALRKLLAALDRERNVIDWPLQRLEAADVATMLVSTFDLKRQPSVEVVQQIHALTEGNPFFIEEVLKSMVASGVLVAEAGTLVTGETSELRIPRSVQAAVQERTSSLSPKALEVIQLAAVTGQRFDFTCWNG